MIDIWLDDIRIPPATDNNWVWVKTAPECIRLLEKTLEFPKCQVHTLSLDHDLGEHPDAPADAGTGYLVAVYLEELAAEGVAKLPEHLLCHSMNPVGRRKILQCFDRIREFQKKGRV